jgi:hypothetical protein
LEVDAAKALKSDQLYQMIGESAAYVVGAYRGLVMLQGPIL